MIRIFAGHILHISRQWWRWGRDTLSAKISCELPVPAPEVIQRGLGKPCILKHHSGRLSSPTNGGGYYIAIRTRYRSFIDQPLFFVSSTTCPCVIGKRHMNLIGFTIWRRDFPYAPLIVLRLRSGTLPYL